MVEKTKKEETKIINDRTWVMCYWENLGTITIHTNHLWSCKKNDEWKNEQLEKVSSIYLDNSGRWHIDVVKGKEDCDKRLKHVNKSTAVNDWVFPRAFKDVYAEMKLQFKITNKTQQLELLKTLFTYEF